MCEEMTESQVLGIFIRGCSFWRVTLMHFGSVVTVHLVDRQSGDSICKVTYTNTRELALSTLNSRYHDVNKRISSNSDKAPLLMDTNMAVLNDNKKILMFELHKFVRESDNLDTGKSRIAWAFLIPEASDGTKNIDKELKLQLYQTGRKCSISHQTCSIFHLFKDHKLKKFPGILCVKIKGVTPESSLKEMVQTTNSTPPPEQERINKIDAVKNLKFTQKLFQWSRLPTQSCKIPNHVEKSLNFGLNGSSCVRFSKSGLSLAVCSNHSIFIYDVPKQIEVLTLTGHNGYIYDMDWTEDDAYLLSVSNDCTCVVWNMKDTSQTFVLPHPSYVYCGKWLNSNKELITGCRDHLLRYWVQKRGCYELADEIRGHSGYVTSVVVRGTNMFIAGDSKGCIAMHELQDNKWTLIKKLELVETLNGTIDAIYLCSTSARVIVSSRSKGSFMVDLKAGIAVQKYKAMVNVVLRSVPCLTPCGSLLFSFCQNGELCVWNAHTGKHIASYESLFPVKGLAELCGTLHYHPFEHMIAIGAFDHNHPVLLLMFSEKNDSRKIGLVYHTDEGKLLSKAEEFRKSSSDGKS